MEAVSDGAPPPPAPKPFLRRGAGWEARMTAAREGRRYVPRGGPVKDYSQDGELALPRRGRSGVPPTRKAAPRSPAKPAGGYARKAASASAAATAPPAAPRARQPARPVRSAAVSAAASPQRQHPPAARAPAAAPDWASRLLQAGGQLAAASKPPAVALAGAPGARPAWEARQAEEVEALEAFEALESQVLREVHTNSPLPRSRAASRGGKAPSAAGRVVAVAASPSAEQWAAPGSACGPNTWPEETVEVDDVFQSDGEGNVRCVFREDSQAQAAAAGISHPLAGRGGGVRLPPGAAPALAPAPALHRRGPPPVYCEDEEGEAEMQAESSFLHELPRPPASGLVQRFFRPPHQPAAPPAAPAAAAATGPQPHPAARQAGDAEAAEAVEALQVEVVRLQEERARVARLRMELEEAAARLELEKGAFEKRKLEEAARFEAERAEELRKLQRDRRVLEKQSRAILKMPTKQNKEEVAAVEALLADERRTGRAREARHKLTVEGLRQQIVELQERNAELRGQVQALEEERLASAWGPAGAAAGGGAAGVSPRSSAAGPAAAPRRSAAAGPMQPNSAAAAAAAAPAVATRQHCHGSQPVVRAERGGTAAGSGRAAVCQPPPCDWQHVAGAEGGAEDAEQLMADEQLAEEELLACEAVEADEEMAGQSSLGPALELGGGCGGHQHGGQLDAQSSWSVPAGHTGGTWSVSAPAAVAAPVGAPAQPAAAAGDAASRATSAVARFNQLRDCLEQQRGLAVGGSRATGPRPSPAAAASLALDPGALPAAGMAAPFAAAVPATAAIAQPAAAAEDDLRRLGRSLVAAGGGAGDLLPPASAPTDTTAAAPAAPPTAGSPGSAGTATAGPEDGHAVVSEVQHPGGRWERLYASGLREQRFANGSVKQVAPGGACLTRFANGDVKVARPGGAVEYWYAEVSSWQVTHPSGVDVYFFPSGQVEAHHPGGVKEIVFPDGAVRKALPDGRELAISAAHLSREIQQPRPEPAL